MAVPLLTALPSGWRLAWLVLAACAAAVCLAYSAFIRDRADPRRAPPVDAGVWRRMLVNPALLSVFAAWALFGFAYIAVSTFFVAFLQEGLVMVPARAAVTWALVGISAAPGPFLAGYLRDVWGSARMIVLLTLALGLSILLLLVSAGGPAAFVAAALFGACIGGITTVVVVYLRELSPPPEATYTIGMAGIIGCIGQAAGPAVAGVVADLTGTLVNTFALSALMCFACVPLIVYAAGRAQRSAALANAASRPG